MFQDEARFGRISDCRYCWAKFPLRPTVKAMLTHQYVYASVERLKKTDAMKWWVEG
jgi:hypothetical protein